MSNQTQRPIVLFTGRFGSGKTETALNYALGLVDGSAPGYEKVAGKNGSGPERVVLVDLDIVTPYFRSREKAEPMQARGVTVISPSIIGQHLHTPAITPQILGAIERPGQVVVLDVGGDKQGARALGQYSHAIHRRGYTMHFVVNPYRPFTDTLQGLESSIAEIESSARLQVSSLVSNPNLIGSTTAADILQGHAQIESFARELGLPITFVCIQDRWAETLDLDAISQPVLRLHRNFVQPWE
ncbi:MAG: hypothetical protein PVF47_06940 [Anaerolineae bacterium]|jgi:hypothetical protein